MAETESRQVLAPAENKGRSAEQHKSSSLSKPKSELLLDNKQPIKTGGTKGKNAPSSLEVTNPPSQSNNVPSILRHKKGLELNVSLNVSCSSDASSDSSRSRPSTGKSSCRNVKLTHIQSQRNQCGSKSDKVVNSNGTADSLPCAHYSLANYVDTYTVAYPCYAAFHDEEWGVPVYDDKKLFEVLSLSTALAELSWPAILNKRHIFRKVFQEFDPIVVSKINEKKIATPASPASCLLSELKLRGFLENARQICKIIEEFGQVPIKTSKADAISKDLVRRGFRGVGPTVVYSFMQVAGMTNDHLISCFRFQDCKEAGDERHTEDNSFTFEAKGKLKQA
ncbi:hypothetical protein LguiB_023092 [Lonicera macranthoides]